MDSNASQWRSLLLETIKNASEPCVIPRMFRLTQIVGVLERISSVSLCMSEVMEELINDVHKSLRETGRLNKLSEERIAEIMGSLRDSTRCSDASEEEAVNPRGYKTGTSHTLPRPRLYELLSKDNDPPAVRALYRESIPAIDIDLIQSTRLKDNSIEEENLITDICHGQ